MRLKGSDNVGRLLSGNTSCIISLEKENTMNREQFIDTLRRALYGKVDDYTLSDHIRYYESYILQEMAKGRSEQEVLDELGDPRLIARTILEASGAQASYKEYTVVNEGEEEVRDSVHVHRFEGWKALAVMAVAAVIILLVLILAFRLVIALFPLLVVIGLLVWLSGKIWG